MSIFQLIYSTEQLKLICQRKKINKTTTKIKISDWVTSLHIKILFEHLYKFVSFRVLFHGAYEASPVIGKKALCHASSLWDAIVVTKILSLGPLLPYGFILVKSFQSFQ